MNDCTSCQQISVEAARIGMIACGAALALLIVFNLDVVRHWWIRQIDKVIARIWRRGD